MSVGKQTPYKLSLEGTIALKNAGALHAQLLVLQNNSAVEIDASAIDQIDFCGLQLLIAAAKTAQSHGLALTLVGTPDGALQSALARGGFLQDGEMIPTLRGCWRGPGEGGAQ
jgi:anti-anti-sigma regulatory factor